MRFLMLSHKKDVVSSSLSWRYIGVVCPGTGGIERGVVLIAKNSNIFEVPVYTVGMIWAQGTFILVLFIL